MTTATAESTESKGKRGGPRGERQWRDKPTPRERVLNQSLSEHIKENTGRDVSPETIRAVRHCLSKWNTSDETKKLRENMDKKLAKAKLQDKREKALEMLREAEGELSKFDGSADLDDDDDDETEESDVDDSSDDDDVDDPFSDNETVSSNFG